MTAFGDIAIAAPWWWMILAVALGIAEIVLPGFFLIWLGAAALLTGAVTLALGLPPAAQFALFAVAAIAAVYGARRWLSRHPGESSDPLLNDRAGRLVGEVVTVIEAIDGGKGRVRVGDGAWPARGPDMAVGAHMRVTGVEGGWLRVEPL